MPKPTLKDLQSKWLPIYINQPKPQRKADRMPISLQLSIEVLLHPILKRY